MLHRTHVEPFLRVERGHIEVDWLEPAADDTLLLGFLDRLCRLVRRVEGRRRRDVVELLGRQERRVRDARRLAGLAKTLLDRCRFEPDPGAEEAPRIREAVYRARGRRWPPRAGDESLPYEDAADELGMAPDRVRALLHADRRDRYPLVRAPRWDGATLLARYNLELARAVLLDAESMTLRADGEWKRIFRAVKLARLMTEIHREGRRRYRIEVTGPAAGWIVRPQRYGVRMARALPQLLAAPGARIEARVHPGGWHDGRHDGRTLPYTLVAADHPWLARLRPRRRSLDSRMEEDLARVLREKIGDERDGWTLVREDAPVPLPGGAVFLPDFTLRHRDGREARIELVGYWTPEYLEKKRAQVRAAEMDNLVLVVSRRLGEGARLLEEDSDGAVVWFTDRPSARPVLEAAERVARVPR